MSKDKRDSWATWPEAPPEEAAEQAFVHTTLREAWAARPTADEWLIIPESASIVFYQDGGWWVREYHSEVAMQAHLAALKGGTEAIPAGWVEFGPFETKDEAVQEIAH